MLNSLKQLESVTVACTVTMISTLVCLLMNVGTFLIRCMPVDIMHIQIEFAK